MKNVRPLEFPRIIDPTRWGESRVSRFVMNKPQLRYTPYSMHSEKGPEGLLYRCPGTVMYEGVSD